MRKNKKLKLKKKALAKNKHKKKRVIFHKITTRKNIKYSAYPYLFVISFFRRNVFFSITNYKGQVKYWTTSGSSGFKGKTKTNYLALVTVTSKFLRKVWTQGFRSLILIFKNCNRKHRAIIKALKVVSKENYKFRFISLTMKTQLVFNGCRKKKKKRR